MVRIVKLHPKIVRISLPMLVLALAAGIMTRQVMAIARGTIASLFINPEKYSVNNCYTPLIFQDWSPPIPLLVSEVMINPVGNEPEAEWVELYNYGLWELDLTNIRIGDSETSGDFEGMYLFPQGAVIRSGEVMVIANQSVIFVSYYGFEPNFELNDSDADVPDLSKDLNWSHGSLSLKNSGDEIILINMTDVIIDMVSWGDSSYAFSPAVPVVPEGHTIERYPPHLDTDTIFEWRDQPSPAPGLVDLNPPPTHTPLPVSPTPSYSSTPSNTPIPTATGTSTVTPIVSQTSTPLATITSTPSATMTSTPSGSPQPSDHLLISEVLYNPYFLEPENEWIEIYNPTLYSISLDNYKVGDEETENGIEGMLTFPPGYSISSEERIIIAYNAARFMFNYDSLPDFEMEDSDPSVPDMLVYTPWASGIIFLDNAGDEVLILGFDDSYIDKLSWDQSNWAFDPPCMEVPEGHSLERYPENIDTDSAQDWMDQPVPNPGT